MIRLTPAAVTLVMLAGFGLLIGAYFAEALREGNQPGPIAELPQDALVNGKPTQPQRHQPAVAEVSPARDRSTGEPKVNQEPKPAVRMIDEQPAETVEQIEVESEIKPAIAQKPGGENLVQVARPDETVNVQLEFEPFPIFQTEQFRGSLREVNGYSIEPTLP